jgi:hypothetical protein
MLGQLPIIDITGWVIVGALVLISMVRGWLVAARQVDRLIAAYDLMVKDKDEQIKSWREAFNNSDARADVLADNQRVLIESMKTTNGLLQDLVYSRPIQHKEISQ